MIPKRAEGVVWDEVDGEGVLCCDDCHEIHVLNVTALHVWRLCDGKHTESDIVESLESSFSNTDSRTLRGDVARIVLSFHELGILERPDQ